MSISNTQCGTSELPCRSSEFDYIDTAESCREYYSAVAAAAAIYLSAAMLLVPKVVDLQRV
jgi:hypothetical protein